MCRDVHTRNYSNYDASSIGGEGDHISTGLIFGGGEYMARGKRKLGICGRKKRGNKKGEIKVKKQNKFETGKVTKQVCEEEVSHIKEQGNMFSD